MSTSYCVTPTIGSRVASHLTLRAVLGEGGAATVFEAYHERLRSTVAVKISMLSGEHAPRAERRLVREAHICARLDDPHFPRVYDVAELSDGRPYFVMERVFGPTLEGYLQGRPLGLTSALRITRELLSALCVAHAQGIVHRDVKPGNVILQESGGSITGIRLMDFGIAKVADPELEAALGEYAEQQELLGTPGYMAPEQISAGDVDGRTDLYAIGMVLYEMLAGRPPFDEEDPVRLMKITLVNPLPDVRLHAPDCPPAIVDWIGRATAIDPRDRFASAAEALRVLQTLDRLTPVPAPPARSPLNTGPPFRERKRPKPRVSRAPLQAALGAAAAAGLWLTMSSSYGPARDGDSTAEGKAFGYVTVDEPSHSPQVPQGLLPVDEQDLPQEPVAALPEAAEAAEVAEAEGPATERRTESPAASASQLEDRGSQSLPGSRRTDAAQESRERRRDERRRGDDDAEPEEQDVPVSEYVQQLDGVLGELGDALSRTDVSPRAMSSDIPDNPYGKSSGEMSEAEDHCVDGDCP